jgi:hypothetical protein
MLESLVDKAQKLQIKPDKELSKEVKTLHRAYENTFKDL